MYRLARYVPEMCDLYTFDSLCKLHLELSKLLKQRVIGYMSLKRLPTRRRGQIDGLGMLLSLRKVVLWLCNILLANIEHESKTTLVISKIHRGVHT